MGHVTVKPIRTEQDNEAALKEIDQLWDAAFGTPEYDKLEILSILVEAYEREHYPIEPPGLWARICFHVDRLGFWRWLREGCPV